MKTEYKNTEIGKIPKDWEVVRLEDISEDLYYGITAKSVDDSTNIRMIRTTDIKNYSVDWDKLPFCEITEKRNNLSKYFLRKGDILIARAGTVGISVLVDNDYDDVIFGSYLIKIKLKSSAYPKFIHYFLQSDLYWKEISKAQGSTLKNINLPILKSIKIPLPPLLEQQKIAEILSTVDQAIQKVDEAIEKTERLKKGLMEKLLTRGVSFGFMFDTNVFNRLIDDDTIDINKLPENQNLYVTKLQEDELKHTSLEERRNRLIQIFEQVEKDVVNVKGIVLDVSPLDYSEFGTEEDHKTYKEMLKELQELDKNARKKNKLENQIRDVLIALTSIRNNLILVSEDDVLREVTSRFGGRAISLRNFLNGRYREFKDTEIGKIPKDWEIVKLGDLFVLKNGKRPKINENGKYPIFGANGIIGLSDDFLIEENTIIIVGRVGASGEIWKGSGKIWVSDNAIYMEKYDKNKVEPLFIYYYLKFKDLKQFATRTTHPIITQSFLREFKIPLPPLPEQQKIAEILSTVDKKLTLQRKRKEKLEMIKKGLMEDLLTGKRRAIV